LPIVPWYQPETAYQIFNRVMFNADVATGKVAADDKYASVGQASVFGIKSEVPQGTEHRDCYTWDMFETCNRYEATIIENGTAIVKDYILIGVTDASGKAVYFNGSSDESAPGNGNGNGNGNKNGAVAKAPVLSTLIAAVAFVAFVGL
jgi:hypothetical protein